MRFLTYILLYASFSTSKSFYVPISRSVSVTKIAKSIKLEDSTVVVSRNSTGQPVAFHDYCPHRSASFHNVVLQQNTISCKYHGFLFDVNDGVLTSGLGVKPGCSSLKMLDCIESNGLVWVCVDGNDDIKPPDLEQESDKTFRKISGSVTIKCPVNRFVENVIDNTHIQQVHSFGNKMDPKPINFKASRISSTHGVSTFQYNAGETSMFNGLLDVSNWYHIPYTAGTMVTSDERVKIVQVHAVQLEDGYTKVFWDLYRNWYIHPIFDSIFDFVMKITLKEDQDILESCSFEHGDKFNGKYDKLQILYRQSMKDLVPPV